MIVSGLLMIASGEELRREEATVFQGNAHAVQISRGWESFPVEAEICGKNCIGNLHPCPGAVSWISPGARQMVTEPGRCAPTPNAIFSGDGRGFQTDAPGICSTQVRHFAQMRLVPRFRLNRSWAWLDVVVVRRQESAYLHVERCGCRRWIAVNRNHR